MITMSVAHIFFAAVFSFRIMNPKSAIRINAVNCLIVWYTKGMLINKSGASAMLRMVLKSAPVTKQSIAVYAFPSLMSLCAGSSAVSGVGLVKSIVGIASIMLWVMPMLNMKSAGIMVLAVVELAAA